MKKSAVNKKQLILPLFILTLLAVNIILVSAAGFWNTVSDWLNNTVLPEGINQGAGSIFVAVIGIILIFVIIGDLLSLVSPLSDWVNWVIGAGVTLIMITMGTARIAIGWVMVAVTAIFGVGGALALVMTAVVFLVSVVLLYFGFGTWIMKIKARRQILDAQKKGTKSAADAIRGIKEVQEIGKNT